LILHRCGALLTPRQTSKEFAMKVQFFTLLALIVAFMAAPLANAATITLDASKDASIFQNNVNNSSGAGNGLIVGTNAQSSARRAAIAFDVASALPAGAVIQNVQLNLVLGSVAGAGVPGNDPADVTIGLHRLIGNWGEGIAQQQSPPTDSLGGQGQGVAAAAGDITWNSSFHGSSLWATPGGDVTAMASASALIDALVGRTKSWASTAELISDVQNWFDNPTSNFGWMLVNTNEASANTGRTFFSSEVATAAFRPQLEITYEVIPEPSTLLLGVTAGLVSLVIPGRLARREPRG
jgi:hypothetical protein